MNIELTVERIKTLSKTKGFKTKYICKNLGIRDNYFTDCKAKKLVIPDDILKPLAIMLDTSIEYLKGDTDDPRFHLSSVGLTTEPYEKNCKRPIFGHASAGKGVIAQQEALGYEQVDPEYDCDDCFWLQVDGDSMSPVLDDHDLVLVKKDTPPETDTLMVVIVDDEEGFVKKISIDEDTVTLRSFNPHYPPRVFGGVEIGRLRFVGRVMELKRRFA